jgi:hypothetical protein
MPLVEVPYVDEKGKTKKQKQFIGAFSYYFDQIFEKTPRAFVEVHPAFPSSQFKTKSKSAYIGSVSTTRTIELWKEPDSETVRVIASAMPEDLPMLEKELSASYPGTRTTDIEQSEPTFVSHASELVKQGYTAYFFDVEQAHALPGCWYDLEQPQGLLDGLVRSLKGRAAWVQITWCDYDWTHAIEQASIVFQKAVDEIRRGVKTTTMSFGGIGSNLMPKLGQSTRIDPHPAAGGTIDVQGDRIARQYFEKAQRHGGILSVRGVILSRTPPEHMNSALASVQISSLDYLAPWYYSDARMLRWLRSRAIPDPTSMLQMHAAGGFLHDWGKGRELIPALCVTSEELPVLVHLPQDPQLIDMVNYTMSSGLPTAPIPKREGIVIADEGLGISFDDLNRGIYLVGMPGVGKSTIEQNLIYGLAKANQTGELPNAAIFIDPKGDDALKLLKKLPNLDPDHVLFCDPDLTNFSVNPLGIPPHDAADDEKIRSLHAEFLFSYLREQFRSGVENTPQMVRFFRAFSTALNRLSDQTTFTDIYAVGTQFASNPKEAIRSMSKAYDPNDPSDALQLVELESLSTIDPKQMQPLMNRMAPFIEPYKMKHLCAKNPTVNFDDMLKPGTTTIIRLAKSALGADAVTWFEAAIILGLWFAIMERARRIPESQRTQVVVAVDEFQNVSQLEAIPTILAEARSAKAGLVLSHQTTAQLDDQTFGEIMGTTSVKGIGRISPSDARRFSAMNPTFSKAYETAAVTQPDYTWLFTLRAQAGQETPPPIQVHIIDQPKDIHTDEEVQAFIEEMKRRQTPAPLTAVNPLKGTRDWVKDLPEDYKAVPDQKEWAVLTALVALGTGNKSDISGKAGYTVVPRDDPTTDTLLNSLVGKGWIEIVSQSGRKDRPVIRYGITQEGMKLIQVDWNAVTTADAGPEARGVIAKLGEAEMKDAHQHGDFIMTANQVGERKVDAIRYSYVNDSAYAIEVESPSHVRTHADQLKAHFTDIPKWARGLTVVIMPESEAEVKQMVSELPQDIRRKVVIHVVEDAGIRTVTVS